MKLIVTIKKYKISIEKEKPAPLSRRDRAIAAFIYKEPLWQRIELWFYLRKESLEHKIRRLTWALYGKRQYEKSLTQVKFSVKPWPKNVPLPRPDRFKDRSNTNNKPVRN